MLNNVILVGRLVENPTIRVSETGQPFCTITLAVVRAYKNSEGEYDTDFIRCVLWEGLAESVVSYCGKGSVLGVKGRLAARTIEVNFEKEGEAFKKNIRTTDVIAERVSFISVKKENKQ